MAKQFISAKEARENTERFPANQLDYIKGLEHIYKIIKQSSKLGLSKIVVAMKPEILPSMKDVLTGYKLVEISYISPAHPDKVNVLIIW